MPALDASTALSTLPEWWPEAMLWLGLGLLAAVVAAAAGAWTLVRRLEGLSRELATLRSLPELERTLARFLSERGELDLKRIEHLLVDLRDGSRRVEELLSRVEEFRAGASDALVPVAQPLGERVMNRLLALGYERIEIVTPNETMESFAQGSGDVLVEARREGVLCKGRVRVRGGRIDSVQLLPAFPVFP